MKKTIYSLLAVSLFFGVLGVSRDSRQTPLATPTVYASQLDESYTLPAHYEPWKREIAARAAELALAQNIEPKYLITAMVLESGITPEARGDGGCSYGVLQVNRCVNKAGWNTEDQIKLWLKNFSEEYSKSASWEDAVVDWNYPAIDGRWSATKYWKDYRKILLKIVKTS